MWARQTAKATTRVVPRVLVVFLAALSYGLAILIFLEVLLRYVARGPTIGLEVLASNIAFWVYFVGGAYAAYEGSHITADIIPALLRKRNPRAVTVIRAFTGIITVGVSLCVLSWAYNYLIWGITKHEVMPYFYLPMVCFQSSIFVGLVLMSFYFLIQTVDYIKASFHGSDMGSNKVND